MYQLHCDPLLTVGTLLGAGSQKQLGHGHVVGHDGDVEGQEALAVGRVEVQLLQAVLGEKQLHQVQLLVLHCFKQGFTALELWHKDSSHGVITNERLIINSYHDVLEIVSVNVELPVPRMPFSIYLFHNS